MPVATRKTLGGTTGHVAESVVSLLLDALEYSVVWHFSGPGGHGIDLLELSPNGESLLAVEVKGTLRSRRWPPLTRGAIEQFSQAWLDKADDPGMIEWSLQATDIYGLIAVVNFADRSWKGAATADFETFRPVRCLDELADPRRTVDRRDHAGSAS